MILSIIIPVFNEEKTIDILLKKVLKVNLPAFIKKEIILVDDGSLAKSKIKIRKFNNIKKIFHKKNLGKGAAIKSGLKVATGDYIIIQDADLEYNPEDYPKMLDPIMTGKSKVVFGTRLTDYPLRLWGKKKTVMPFNLIANKLLTSLTNLLYGSKLTDMETCYKLIKASIFKKINIRSQKFDFEPEITAKILKLKIRIIEIPIKVKPRTYEEGKKIKWTDGLFAIWALIKYRFID